MNISINSPSWKKCNRVDLVKWCPDAVFWVCESQADLYKENNPGIKLKVVKKGIQGKGKPKIINHILDVRFKEKVDAVCLMDDDIKSIGYYENKERFKMDFEYFKGWLVECSRVAQEWGVKMWGINLNTDYQSYREYSPFSMLSPILAPFWVIFPNPLRQDERFPLKHDYDYFLQMVRKYRKVLRFNKYHYDCRMTASGSGTEGGSSDFRSVAMEMRELERLKRKWGSKIVKYDFNDRCHQRKKRKTFDINPVVRVPIKGI